ncbi:MAG: class I SAM-dependent methyltransferase [Acetobacteraceae bacterium]|nr:class I SAM-dependent methyltransferase [Acetobacteraceae bacterium]MSP30323.1 class I SAM-dependent methyltransferase [Acetobacteraceae bacterium]
MTVLLEPGVGRHVLDIGGGIGGPARWLAWRFGCSVPGADLSRAFCDAAKALNIACDIAERVGILHGSVLNLPLADAMFDRAYSQNIVMNIADKVAMYSGSILRPETPRAPRLVQLGPGAEWSTVFPCAVGQ